VTEKRRRRFRSLPRITGKTKTRAELYVASSTGRWHRIDRSSGQRTACGVGITATWSFPTDKKPGKGELRCKIPECELRDN